MRLKIISLCLSAKLHAVLISDITNINLGEYGSVYPSEATMAEIPYRISDGTSDSEVSSDATDRSDMMTSEQINRIYSNNSSSSEVVVLEKKLSIKSQTSVKSKLSGDTEFSLTEAVNPGFGKFEEVLENNAGPFIIVAISNLNKIVKAKRVILISAKEKACFFRNFLWCSGGQKRIDPFFEMKSNIFIEEKIAEVSLFEYPARVFLLIHDTEDGISSFTLESKINTKSESTPDVEILDEMIKSWAAKMNFELANETNFPVKGFKTLESE